MINLNIKQDKYSKFKSSPLKEYRTSKGNKTTELNSILKII